MYLLSIKIESLRLVIPRLKQDKHKVVIEKITNDAGASIKKISIGLVIKYINQHYEELLNQERTDPELRERTADIIGQYSSNGICKSALDYIAENDGYMVIDRFEDFEKAIENDTDLFHKLFPTGHLSEIDTLRYKEILNIWAYILNKEKSSLKALALKSTLSCLVSVCQTGRKVDTVFKKGHCTKDPFPRADCFSMIALPFSRD